MRRINYFILGEKLFFKCYEICRNDTITREKLN